MTTRISLGYIFLAMILAATISCSSGDKEQQGASPDVAEATSDQGAPPPPDASAAAPADASGQPADAGAPADPNGAPPPADANAAPPDANGAPADAAKAPETTENEMAAADSGAPPPPADPNAPADANAAPPADQGAAAPGDASAAAPPADANGAPPADANGAPPADAGAPAGTDVANNAAPGGDAGQSDLFGTGAGDAPAPKPHHVGVAHIKDAPFTKGGQNLNTVYIARDGDTLPAISQKLFGEDDSKKLIKANPTLKKAVHTGDKVYFNSPNRPDDKDRMLTVYEDQGVAPSSYTTKDGDTLKALAQEWYGSEDSWKEIYALNKGLTSTKTLPAGTELQYWPATAQVAVYGAKKNDVAQSDMNNPDAGAGGPPPGNNAPPPDMNNAPPPPPPGGQAANNVPPPPPAAGAVNNALPPPPANLPPPPAPPDMNSAPPPAPPMMTKKHHDMGNSIGGMDKDTIMEAVAGGVLLVGAALLIAIRRRNSRRNSGITQV